MMQAYKSTFLAAAMLTTVACAGIRVETDYDPEATFATRGTYDWLDSAEIAEELEGISPFLERRIRRAVDLTMEFRGYQQELEGDVDFLVSAFVVAPDGYDVSRCPGGQASCRGQRVSIGFGIGHPYPYGFGYPWYGFHRPFSSNPWGYTYAYRIGFGYSWLPMYSRPSGSLPGTLVIDILDPVSGELVWRGWAEGALLRVSPADERQEYLDKIVARILEEFPPTPPSR